MSSLRELYTIVTNKSAHCKKGSLVAMVHGTKSEYVIMALNKLPRSMRLKVEEITLDLSPTMKLIAQRCFPNAILVSDRFHVQKLMNEAVSDLRISHRWKAMDLENAEMALAKEVGRKFINITRYLLELKEDMTIIDLSFVKKTELSVMWLLQKFKHFASD